MECPDFVYQTQIPDEFKGMQRKDVIITLLERGLSTKCVAQAIFNWFPNIKSLESAEGYVRSVRSRYMKKREKQEEKSEEKEEESEEKEEKKAEATELGVPSELLPAEAGEAPAPAEEEKEETGGGFAAIEVSDEDIVNLYGAIWEAIASYYGVRAEDILPEERIRTTGRYMAKIMRKLGILDSEAFIFAAFGINIASDIAIAMRRIRELKKREAPIVLPEKREEKSHTEQKTVEPNVERLKSKMKQAWRRAGGR